MARQVLPWVGAAVGFWLGGPAGAQFGFAIGGMVGNAVDPQVINGPKLGEGQDTTASEGAYRPIVLGKGKVGTCIINQGPLIKRTIRHKQSKGGGPITTEERFYRTMAFAVGEPADVDTGVQLLRMWVDGKLSYDVTPTSQIVADSAEFAETFTFYPGTMGQQPDPDIEAYMGAGNVSAYQGAPYIVFPHYDVTQAGGRAPLIHVELASAFGAILPTSVLAMGRTSTGGATSRGATQSLDGRDWGPAINAEVNLGKGFAGAAAIGQRIIRWTGSSSTYSDDDGLTWSPSNGFYPSAWGGQHKAHIVGSVLLIPIGAVDQGGGLGRSLDGGSTYQVVGSFASNHVAIRGGTAISTARGGPLAERCRVSTDSGASFTLGGEHGLGWLGVNCIHSSPTKFMVGGALDSKPAVSVTIAGLAWSPEFVSSEDGRFVSELCYGTPMGVARWVAILDNGGIYFRNDNESGWVQADDDLGQTPYGVVWNGARYIAAGQNSGSASSGRIKTSEDGITWVTRSQPLAGVQLIVAKQPSASSSSDKVPLSHIVSWLHDRVNFHASKYDVSELDDLVEGVVFGDGYTVADAIRAAGGWYFFDAGEFDGGSGYRIHYVKRGGAAVATLADQDIVEGPEDWEREDSYERPRVLHVAYQNPVMDYGAPTIPIKRTSPDVLVVGERSLSVPFVHSDQDEVAQRGDIAMTVAYTEIAGKYEVVLPVDWLSLAPTDTIGFSIRGRTRRLRMVSWRYSPDGTIKTEWMADRQSAYTSDLTALPPTPTTPPPPSIVGPTVSAVLDIPALTDSLDSLHLVLAASGQTPAWWGSIHQRRLEAETDFSTAMVFNPPTTIMGVLSDGVSAASPHYTDTTNVVRVTLYSDDELDTHTQQQFLSENGAFALSWDDGGTRRWEILQYRDAVKVGDQEWELSTLARGRVDTATAPHPSGSMFVLLDVGVRAAPAQVSWIGQDIEHRAVSNGQQPDQAITYTEEYTGQSQREWPVAGLFGEIDGDDLVLTCVPRHRFGTDDNPVQSINHDGYRWTATDGSSSVTADTSSPSHTFDVTGWATPITVTVAQLNRITGAGPTVSETIDA